jgi:hypothetical protein
MISGETIRTNCASASIPQHRYSVSQKFVQARGRDILNLKVRFL